MDEQSKLAKDYEKELKAYEATLPPKRPLSSFLQFSKARRPLLQKENSDLSMVEISSKLGQEWKALPESEKKKYHDTYLQKNEEWKKAYNEWASKNATN